MRNKATALILTALVSGLLLLPGRANASADRPVRIDIPAQDMLTALRAFSRATGLTVAVDPSLVSGRRSASTVGRLDAETSLNRLVSPAGLRALPVGAGFVVVVAASAGQTPVIPASPTASPEAVSTLSEIVVTGIRAAASSSIEARRDALGVREVIFAEDVARLPEQNLAEAIQRSAGVHITRAFGEGQQVGVRGIGPEFTQVLLNGARLASDTSGRETDLDTLSAETFSRIDIVKTASADLPEGGLGGTILLETPKPFDFAIPPTVLTLGGALAAIDKTVVPQAFFTTGHRSSDDRFGILGSVRSFQTRGGQDGAHTVSWERRALDLDGDQRVDVQDIYLPRVPRTLIETRDRERIDGLVAIQIEPWADVALDVQINGSYQRDRRTRHTMDGVLRAPDIIVRNLEILGENALAGSFSNVEQRSENINEANEQRLFHAVGEARWSHGADNYAVTLSSSRAEEHAPLNTRILFSARGDFGYDFTTNRRIPALSTSLDLLDPGSFRLSQVRYESYLNQDRIDGMKFRGDRRLDGIFGTVSYGLQFEDREKTRRRGLFNDASQAGKPVNSFVRRSRHGFPVGLHEVPPGFPRQWLVTDFDAARRTLFPEGFEVPPDYSDSFSVRETTYAAFAVLAANRDGENLSTSAEVGLRLVQTDQHSQGWRTQGGQVTPVATRKTYADILPSLDLRLRLADRHTFDLSLARVVTRASLNDLSPREAVDIFGLRVLRGNPDLDPFRAWQLDLSYSFYFAPSAVVSMTAFSKSIESFITIETSRTAVEGLALARDGGTIPNGEIFTITQPVNGDAANLSGIELSYRQPTLGFPAPFSGFGLAANYTYAESDARISTGEISRRISLPGQSRHTGNLIVTLETQKFDFQWVYNHRSAYVGRPFVEGDQTEIFDEYGQMDFLAMFRPTRNAEVYFNAFNILSEVTHVTAGDPSRMFFHQGSGPSVAFGVRLRL